MEFVYGLIQHLSIALCKSPDEIENALNSYGKQINSNSSIVKLRYNYDFLIKFWKENNIELRKDYKLVNLIRDTIIEAKCSQCDNNMVPKTFKAMTLCKNFGCELHKKDIRNEKSKATILERHGCEYPSQSIDIKN
jgi:hypothetical protein